MPIKHICLFVFLSFISVACQPQQKALYFAGETMGTTYNIVVISDEKNRKDEIEGVIKTTLERVNEGLSNWDSESEIVRFNAQRAVKPVKISQNLTQVIAAANVVHQKSEGFFDITISPLTDLWGFGPGGLNMQEPAGEDIQVALSKVGQANKLAFDENRLTLRKLDPDTQINLSALGKGFGIDKVADALISEGLENFMVEIGGDLIAKGQNAKGESWQIGIEQPEPLAFNIQRIVKLNNMAMATSGDYKNYFEKDGVRYSHIINPKSGKPVTHKTASVTVISQSAMIADAWATALLVLGVEHAMNIAEKNQIAAFFIFKTKDRSREKFETSMSSAFQDLK